MLVLPDPIETKPHKLLMESLSIENDFSFIYLQSCLGEARKVK